MDYKDSKKQKNRFTPIIVCIFWIIVWQLLSLMVGEQLLLPSPITTCKRIIEILFTLEFWKIIAASILRISIGLIAGTAIGIVFSFFTSRYELVNTILSPLLSIIKATPVASFIILMLLWIGRDAVPSVISVLMVIPVVWSNLHEGIKSTDPFLIEAGKSLGSDDNKLFATVIFPSIMPSFIAALKSSIGLAWKSGIAAEILTLPSVSIGKMIFNSKLYLETTDLFAWTVSVIVISMIIENLLIKLINSIYR